MGKANTSAAQIQEKKVSESSKKSSGRMRLQELIEQGLVEDITDQYIGKGFQFIGAKMPKK